MQRKLRALLAVPPLRLSAAGLAAAVALPGAVTLLAPLTEIEGKPGPAVLYVLAVVLATALQGLWAGTLASLLSIFAYIYFFVRPFGSFAADSSAEVIIAAVALGVTTLVVAQIVGGQQAFAERTARAARAVSRGEARYRSLAEASAQVVWSAGPADVDRSLAAALPSGPTGGDWLSCVHGDDRERVRRLWMHAVAEGLRFDVECRVDDGEGGWRTMALRAVPVLDSVGTVTEWVGTVSDVTLRRHSEYLLRARARQQLGVADLGRLALTGSLRTLLDEAAKTLATTLEVEAAAVARLDRVEERLSVAGAYGFDPDPTGTEIEAGEGTLAARVLAAQAPLLVPDLGADVVWDAVRRLGAASAITFQIRRRGGRPWGLLGAFSVARREFGMDDASFVRAVANVVAAALEREAAWEEVHEREAQLRLALEVAGLGAWEWDLRTNAITWDELERTHGLEEPLPRTFEAYMEHLHPDDRPEVEAALRRAVEEGGGYAAEFRFVRPDGETVWIEGQGDVVRDEEGRAITLVGLARNITERRRREHTLAFLAEAGEALSATLDPERTLGEVARLAVPRLADCCVVEVLGERDRRPQVLVVHVDPAKEELVRRLEIQYPTDPSEPRSYVGRAIAERRPLLVADADEAFLAEVAQSGEHLADLRTLGLTSVAIAPLVARGRTLGGITLLTGGARRLTEVDLSLAADLARIAALAVDNARLYHQRSHIAATLQQSLLPAALPEIGGVELAARYRAVGEGLEVGGDFYDVFALGDERFAVAVGDVCGKGTEAAAVTGLTRYTLRAAARPDARPTETLSVLNDALLREYGGTTFATVIFGRLEAGGEEGIELVYACGGHPSPLCMRASGEIFAPGGRGTLVGLFPDPDFGADVELRLGPGDLLLLYTDGLSEGLGGSLDAGEEELRRVLEGARGLGAVEVADLIAATAAAAMPASDRDDVALLVIRVPLGRPAGSESTGG